MPIQNISTDSTVRSALASAVAHLTKHGVRVTKREHEMLRLGAYAAIAQLAQLVKEHEQSKSQESLSC